MVASVPHSRQRLSEAAYEKLRDMIIRAVLPPGSRIAENEFAARLGISRTPIREALLSLADDGLVETIPQSGTFVAPVRMEAVTEAQFIREQLECAVARELAVRIDDAGIATLRANLSLQKLASKAHDLERFYTLDEHLHEQFCELANRTGVWRAIKRSKPHLDRVRWLSLPVADQLPHLITQHRAIVDALTRHEPDAAEAALRVHLRDVYRSIEKLGLADNLG
jgi:DNA-binding GntR family transcriptional regulator